MWRETKESMVGPLGGASRRHRSGPAARSRNDARDKSAVRHEGVREMDLGVVMAAAVQMAADDARQRGVRLAARAYGAVPVLADPVLLFGAVEGLVSNAIARSAADGAVVCAVRLQDGEAVISVADEGKDLGDADLGRMLWPHAGAVEPARGPKVLDSTWLARTRNLIGARFVARSRGPGAGIVLSLHIPLARA